LYAYQDEFIETTTPSLQILMLVETQRWWLGPITAILVLNFSFGYFHYAKQ
jgi:hypothetical protein